MGNGSSKSGGLNQRQYIQTEVHDNEINRGTLNIPRPLLKYHDVKGSNINLNGDKTIATRRPMFFCKGIAFSDRPVEIDEIICIRIAETSIQWSGVLRFGLTNVDPSNFRDIELPKFACPELTQKSGYWAKALPEKYCNRGSVLHFYVNRYGLLYYGFNGVNKGVFLSEVDVTKPLWIMLDIYGNTIGIEFVGTIDRAVRAAAEAIRSESTSSVDDVSSAIASSQLHEQEPSSSSNPTPRTTPMINTRRTPPPRPPPISVGLENLPYKFHQKVGVNINRINDWEVKRKDNQYCRGYCFLNRPIQIDEIIAIRIEATETLFNGAIGFGLTSCNPVNINTNDLPEDSDLLLERPEYWVVMKDVAVLPDLGDILQFQLKQDGRLLFSKNESIPRTILHMDTSVDLWIFFDVFGKTKGVKLCRPREHIFHREQSTGSSLSSEDDFINVIAPIRIPTSNRRLPDISFSPASSTSDMNYQLNVARTDSDDDINTLLAAARRSRERIIENASNTINQVREESSSERETPRRILTTEEVLRRTEEFLNALNNLPSSSNSPTTSPTSRTTNPLTTTSTTTSTTANLLNTHRTPGLSYNSSPMLGNYTTLSSNYGSRSANDVLSTSTQPSRPQIPQRNRNGFTFAQPMPATPSSSSSSQENTNLVTQNTQNSQSKESTPPNSTKETSRNRSIDIECSICLSERANAVIYRCGHVCTCMSCARTLMTKSDSCPMCRQPIIDVIQVFFS